MYNIPTDVYDTLSRLLCEAMGDGSYFSGRVETTVGDTRIQLIVTLISSRRADTSPDGRIILVESVVPVWWECHTTCGAVEFLNDCDFGEIIDRMVD